MRYEPPNAPDGTNIYMTLSVLFLAQATNTPLAFGQELIVLLFAMIASKGGSGVSGNGFVTLAATLAVVPEIPLRPWRSCSALTSS